MRSRDKSPDAGRLACALTHVYGLQVRVFSTFGQGSRFGLETKAYHLLERSDVYHTVIFELELFYCVLDNDFTDPHAKNTLVTRFFACCTQNI
jgi:hypothetical protein